MKANVQAVIGQACGAMLEQLGYSLALRRDGAADGQYELVATPH